MRWTRNTARSKITNQSNHCLPQLNFNIPLPNRLLVYPRTTFVHKKEKNTNTNISDHTGDPFQKRQVKN